MKILAIETSCDDTSIAVAECQPAVFNLISNAVSSQIEIHKKYGGVYPAMARREHQKNLVPVLEETLVKLSIFNNQEGKSQKSKVKSQNYKSKIKNEQGYKKQIKQILERENILEQKLLKFLEKYKKPNIDLIAVTKGPGLEPCLWTGINFAKTLAYAWNLPLIGINHIEAHIFAGFLKEGSSDIKKIKKFLPAIALIVSGGHTQLILVKEINKYEIIGETRDDAAGEAFDKIARILGLSYPGGPEIEKIAKNSKKGDIRLPRPMINSKDYDFSFSGLKTAVLYKYKNKKQRKTMAKEAQQAIIEVLLKKTLKASKNFHINNIIIGGGVSANQELKKQFQKYFKNLKFPLPLFSTDNAAMIALCACLKKKKSDKITAEANLRL